MATEPLMLLFRENKERVGTLSCKTFFLFDELDFTIVIGRVLKIKLKK